MIEQPADIDAILARLDAIEALPLSAIGADAGTLAAEQLVLADTILEMWVIAHGGVPTTQRREGFRLLALHWQGAKGDPSFNACRETCREAVFQHNVIAAATSQAERVRGLRLMTMVVRHLALFVSGKLEVSGLGDFCCASRPLRQSGDSAASPHSL